MVTSDPNVLRWPYLRSVLDQGKKLRLDLPMSIVWQELEVSLLAYVEFKLRKVPLAQRGLKESQYDAWKDAILRLC